MKYIVTKKIKNHQESKEVKDKTELFIELFEFFSQFNYKHHVDMLLNAGFTQKEILRYGTLGTFSLFLISRPGEFTSEYNFDLADSSIEVNPFYEDEKIPLF